MNYLIFDTETTGLPKDYNAPYTDTDNYPRLVQLAWTVFDDDVKLGSYQDIIKPDGFIIPDGMIHGISNQQALEEGENLKFLLDCFLSDVRRADLIICHNYNFDSKIVACEFHRIGRSKIAEMLLEKDHICTMMSTIDFCELPNPRFSGSYKYPSLSELYKKLFGEDFKGAHNAMNDVNATAKCFFELKKRGVI